MTLSISSCRTRRPMSHDIDPRHAEYLTARGLTLETIQANGLHSARPGDLSRLAGRPVPDGTSGLTIPYRGSNKFCRVRLFPPIPQADGKAQKFGQPARSGVHLYIPAGVQEVLDDSTRIFYVVEGEVKALALTQAGYPCVGLGGIWNFREKATPEEGLLPALETLHWADRAVYLVPDSDGWTNEHVTCAVFAFARLIEKRGGTPLVVKLPTLNGHEKTGADDYVVVKGALAFQRLVEKAVTLGHPAFKPWREREKTRGREARAKAGALPAEAEAPWPTLVDGGHLLKTLADSISRFVVLPAYGAETCALWILAAHTLDAMEIFPLLAVVSPVKRCGKTKLLEVLRPLVPRPLSASNISPAVVYRTIREWNPTLLIDEMDTFIQGNDELRGVLNSGHSRALAFVVRVEGEGKDRHPEKFSTWCAKVLACIGTLPSTLDDRAICLRMQRKPIEKKVVRANRRTLQPLGELSRQASRWAKDHLPHVAEASPTLPEELDDRAQDNWHPLLSVAKVVGGIWPDIARKAALVLSAGRDADDEERSIRLLRDIREVFEEKCASDISSAELTAALIADEEWGWDTAFKGKPLNQRGLARMLKPFGIRTKNIKMNGRVPKSYEKSAFEDIWSRYLAFLPLPPLLSNENRDLGPLSEPLPGGSVADEKVYLSIEKHREIAVVADRRPENGGVEL